MCFALAAFNPAGQPVRIFEPQCVAKTFPDFFEALFSVTNASTANIPVVCVDGPTASGKGTLAAHIAQRLGYHYLDSGALYRLTALAAQQALVALDDAQGVAAIAKTLPARFFNDRTFLGDLDVTDRSAAKQLVWQRLRCPHMQRSELPCLRCNTAFGNCRDLLQTGATWAV